MRPIVRNIIYTSALVFLILIISIQPVDYESFEDQEYFKTSLSNIQSLNFTHSKMPFTVGWGKASITPEEPVRLTGLRFKVYDSIADSIWVKSFIFANDQDTIALITYDLWIIHPHLSNYIEHEIHKRIPSIHKIYFTATHTHSSIGGWANGVLGQFIVGGNHEEVLQFIGDQTIQSLENSISNLAPAEVSYGKASTHGLVVNRLDRKHGPVDEELRYLHFQKEDDKTAVFSTFSAHTVFLSKDENNLSADYPGPFLRQIRKSESMELAAFAAGTMGSHTPVIVDRDDSYQAMESYAGKLSGFYLNSTKSPLDSILSINFHSIPVSIPVPQLRITENYRLRPWVSESILGKEPAFISCLQLGNILMVGLPIELSGEFYPFLEDMALRKGYHLMVTSFNGTYLGYAPKNVYYNQVKKAETRSMNWYGPYSGEYFEALIEQIIHQL